MTNMWSIMGPKVIIRPCDVSTNGPAPIDYE